MTVCNELYEVNAYILNKLPLPSCVRPFYVN